MSKHTTLLLCTCEKTQTFDADLLQAAAGAEQTIRVDALCAGDLPTAVDHLSATNRVVMACGQQTALFERLADEIEAETGHVAPLATLDIRDRAGWSGAHAKPERIHAKQAALIAASQLPAPLAPLKTISSNGVCCIVGPTDKALKMAALVQDELGVTCVVNDSGPIQMPSDQYDVARGQLVDAKGALGCFELQFAELSTLSPTGRGQLTWQSTKPTATSQCDVFIDLRGQQPAFPAHQKRNGYFWADPAKSGELERIAVTARERVGEFEKTVYFKLESSLCAHSRAKQDGCTRCLDICPTQAISSAGDHVAIDPNICAGCGGCAAVCPTSAITLTETPFENLTQTLSTMAKAYREACAEDPRLLVHSLEAGAQTIAHQARHGQGLPDDLIPLGLSHIERMGHAELMAAFAAGFTEVLLLADTNADRDSVAEQLSLAQAMLRGAGESPDRIQVIDASTVDQSARNAGRLTDNLLLVGGRRDITRLTLTAIAGEDAAPIKLPVGAPYGAVEVNPDKCTLCLACVSLCPTGALGDHPDRPEIQFTENACVQCSVCASTCPETAITLQPQMELSKAALSPRALHGEDPFECISCGVPFGVASTINRIVEKLENKHWMFTQSDNVQLVKMCDDCRVKAQFHGDTAPMAGGPRPKTRTSDDYLDS